MPGLDDHSEFDGITSVTPVARIEKVTNANPAVMYVNSLDFGKFKEGDMVHISRQKDIRGRGLFDNQKFVLAIPDADDSSFLLVREGQYLDATHVEGDVLGGFAQLVGTGEVPASEPMKKGAPAKTLLGAKHVANKVEPKTKRDNDDD